MSNAEMENNRKTVQEGLNKRANKRNKAIIEAEQEVITVQMFQVVNTKVPSGAIFYQPVYREEPVHKANKKPSKKLIRLRNVSVINACASLVAFIIPIILYFIGKTELIVTSALPALMFIYNIVHFAKAQKKLKRRK